MSEDVAADAELRALEQQRCRAMLAGDLQTLRALLAPELRYVHSTGVVDTRDSLLAKLGTGQIAYQQLRLEPILCTQGTDVGSVAGQMHATLLRGGAPRQITASYLAVWRLRDGMWQLAAYQGTALPPA